jgi:hypothetical protein
MGSNPPGDTRSKQATGISACCARMLGKSNLAACHTDIHLCHWRFPANNMQFCAHPSNRQIAEGIMPTGWSISDPNIC